MRILNYLVLMVFIGLCLVTSTYSQTVTKLDGENMEISTVVTKKISIKRLREERDRLLWQQAESANRFNAVIYDLNTIISDFEKK